MRRYLNKILCLLGLLLSGTALWAQDQQYYVYIQNERPQPFYVKHNGKLLSSSDRGYIIISKLDAGTTPITIGFPKNEAPEQEFKIRLAGKNDQGYLLKADGDKGYALYNLQTFRVTKNDAAGASETAAAETPATQQPPEEDTAKKAMMASLQKDLEASFANKAEVNGPHKQTEEKPAKKSDNPFSAALDKVVSDDRPADVAAPVVAAAPVAGTVVEPEAPATENNNRKSKKKRKDKEPLTAEEQALLGEVIAEEHKEAAIAGTDGTAGTADQPAEEPARKPRKARKKNSNPDFIEFGEDAAKTATVPDATGAAASAALPVTTAITSTGDNSSTATGSTKKSRKKKKLSDIIDMEEQPNNIITDSSGYGVGVQPERLTWKERRKREKEAARQQSATSGLDGQPITATPAATLPAEEGTAKKESNLKMVNSDCANVMDDAAYRKVLRRFVAAKDDDGMIEAFRKNTRNYCLETSQIRSLVQLLSSDENKYKLLDLAYPKAYNSEQFGSLVNLLSDNYYQGRFKAMIKK